MSLKNKRVRSWIRFMLDWEESEHPRAENGQFTSSGEGGGAETLEDLFGDLWNEPPEETAERKAREKSEREKSEAEEKERSSFAQNGLLENDYPSDLRLTKKERKFLESEIAGFFDRRGKKSDRTLFSEMYRVANGREPLELEAIRNKSQKDLDEANEMIAQRVAEGYKGQSRQESYRKWQAVKAALAEADETEIGAILSAAAIGGNGIQAWQIQRKRAMENLADCKLIDKLRKRAEYAKNKG